MGDLNADGYVDVITLHTGAVFTCVNHGGSLSTSAVWEAGAFGQ